MKWKSCLLVLAMMHAGCSWMNMHSIPDEGPLPAKECAENLASGAQTADYVLGTLSLALAVGGVLMATSGGSSDRDENEPPMEDSYIPRSTGNAVIGLLIGVPSGVAGLIHMASGIHGSGLVARCEQAPAPASEDGEPASSWRGTSPVFSVGERPAGLGR